jgi:hypothetical protein
MVGFLTATGAVCNQHIACGQLGLAHGFINPFTAKEKPTDTSCRALESGRTEKRQPGQICYNSGHRVKKIAAKALNGDNHKLTCH